MPEIEAQRNMKLSGESPGPERRGDVPRGAGSPSWIVGLSRNAEDFPAYPFS